MKKVSTFLCMLAVMFSFCFTAQADDDSKHEIAVSYGALSNSQIIDAFADDVTIVASAGKVTFGHDHYVGPIGVEYFYHINPLVGVGAIGVFGMNKQNVYDDGNKIGEVKFRYFTLLPAVKLDWLRKEKFGMYSKLGVGATLRSDKVSTPGAGDDDTETNFHFNWQASLVGAEFGSEKVRGFVELGFGEQGIALAGVRCKF